MGPWAWGANNRKAQRRLEVYRHHVLAQTLAEPNACIETVSSLVLRTLSDQTARAWASIELFKQGMCVNAICPGLSDDASVVSGYGLQADGGYSIA
jgi:hypothetical protein